MTREEWEYLKETDFESFRKKYLEFMNNNENECNCVNCPANEDFSSWPGTRLPCGQFQCWVCSHCHH